MYRAILLAMCGWASQAGAAGSVDLIYSANLNGELEPCGCAAGVDFGGISRRASFIDGLRGAGEAPVLIEAGGLLSTDIAADRIKNDYILSGFATLGYDAVGVQWADLAHGPEFLRRDGLNLVAGNWTAEPGFDHERRIERGDVVLSFTQWLDPEASPYRDMKGARDPVEADTAGLRARLEAARARGDTTVVAATLELPRAGSVLPMELIDVLLVQAYGETPEEPEQVGSTLVLKPSTRGMRLGRVRLQTSDDGRISGWSHVIEELPVSIPDAERLAGWYAGYNDALRLAYQERVRQRKARETGESPYLGEAVCKTCHAGAHAVWAETRHGRAYATLKRVDKAFDPHCIGCHTVGFGSDGGFLDTDLTPHLTNVQCEACHGPGRAHVAGAGQVSTAHREWAPEQICAQCHRPEHSPAFDLGQYWPRIEHGREAVPAQ